jgi:hypothetical protein
MIFQFLFIILWHFLFNTLLLIAVGHQHNPSTGLLRPEEPQECFHVAREA